MNLNELINHSAWKNADGLAELMKQWSDAYYNEGDSPVKDSVYDAAKQRLEVLDPYHPYLAVVGAPVNVDGMVRHKIPMGSLDNVMNEQEFRDWWNKIQPERVIVQYKYDGLSLGLEYKDGNLVRGLSRGDGIYGEDLTENVCNCYHSGQINNLNEQFNGCVRGEGIVYKEDFNDENFPGESNPRNSAVGAIRKSNSPRAKWVRLACYDLVNGKEFEQEIEKLQYMEHLGLPVCYYEAFDNPDDVIEFYSNLDREGLPFAVDGLVVKIDNISRQKELGSKNGRPRWAKAFKFPTLTGVSTVREIILTVGHTGNVIPTAEYDPITIEGRVFRHALLDNFDTIEKFNLNIGDEIEIGIMGDIIPKIVRVTNKNTEGHFPRPTQCPTCGASTIITGAYTVCTGDSCPAKSIGKINNWIKKTGIKYLGESRQKELFEAGVVKKPADLYRATQEDIGDVIGGGNAVHVVEQINKYRTLPLHVFMGALGIKFLGRSNARKLIQSGIDSLYKFLTFDPEVEKERIEGFGDNLKEIAIGIENCKDTINSLIEAGVDIAEPTQAEESQSESEGGQESLSFCFTGVRLGNLKDAFEAKGWTEKSGVSGNLDYLVAKDPTANSGKLKKARDKDVKIISLAEFEEMLNA